MHFFLYILIFYAICMLFFLSYEILYNTIKWQCSSLCFNDITVVQILAVYVLLSSSESVGTHCMCANVYNAQHGHVQIQRGVGGQDPLEKITKLYGFL